MIPLVTAVWSPGRVCCSGSNVAWRSFRTGRRNNYVARSEVVLSPSGTSWTSAWTSCWPELSCSAALQQSFVLIKCIYSDRDTPRAKSTTHLYAEHPLIIKKRTLRGIFTGSVFMFKTLNIASFAGNVLLQSLNCPVCFWIQPFFYFSLGCKSRSHTCFLMFNDLGMINHRFVCWRESVCIYCHCCSSSVNARNDAPLCFYGSPERTNTHTFKYPAST